MDQAMPLFIRDAEVDALMDQLLLIKKMTKTEVVKEALKTLIESHNSRRSLRQKLEKTLLMAQEAGPFATGNHKRDTDDLWGKP